MSLKILAIFLAISLYSTAIHGFLLFRGNRCLCRGSPMNLVNPANVKNVLIIFPSGTCDKKEIIITLKRNRGQRCLNPESKQGKLILERYKKNS